MKLIAHLLCIIACLPTIAASLEDRLSQIQAVEGVEVATIVMDSEGKAPALTDLPGFPGWRVAKIAYLIIDNDAARDNTIAVVIDPDGNALWSQQTPAILAEVPEREGPIGTESEIIAAIEQDQSVTALKYSIDFDIKGADVLIVIDVDGKAVEQHYRVYKRNGAFVVKAYDAVEPKVKAAR